MVVTAAKSMADWLSLAFSGRCHCDLNAATLTVRFEVVTTLHTNNIGTRRKGTEEKGGPFLGEM